MGHDSVNHFENQQDLIKRVNTQDLIIEELLRQIEILNERVSQMYEFWHDDGK